MRRHRPGNAPNGESYIKLYPKFGKWINECRVCHVKGYSPDLPEQITVYEGSLGSRYIKKYFDPLPLNQDGMCEECAKVFAKLDSLNNPESNEE